VLIRENRRFVWQLAQLLTLLRAPARRLGSLRLLRRLVPCLLLGGLLAGSALFAAGGIADTTPAASTREGPSEASRQTGDATLAESAARWQLSIDEYRRYLSAVSGLRGKISDARITPIEVLGIEARDDAERQHYAELYVEMMWADAGKVLAYTRAVQDAWERLHPGAQLVSLERIDEWRARHGSARPPLAGRTAARLIVFTRTGCGSCDGKVRAALSAVAAGRASGADLYVLGVPASHDDKIRAWARTIPIPPDLVEAGTVTLNYDNGTMKQMMDRMRMTLTVPSVIARSPQGALAIASLP
jgi:integrating conjugative element protein (TIGR03759 family)